MSRREWDDIRTKTLLTHFLKRHLTLLTPQPTKNKQTSFVDNIGFSTTQYTTVCLFTRPRGATGEQGPFLSHLESVTEAQFCTNRLIQESFEHELRGGFAACVPYVNGFSTSHITRNQNRNISQRESHKLEHHIIRLEFTRGCTERFSRSPETNTFIKR